MASAAKDVRSLAQLFLGTGQDGHQGEGRGFPRAPLLPLGPQGLCSVLEKGPGLRLESPPVTRYEDAQHLNHAPPTTRRFASFQTPEHFKPSKTRGSPTWAPGPHRPHLCRTMGVGRVFSGAHCRRRERGLADGQHSLGKPSQVLRWPRHQRDLGDMHPAEAVWWKGVFQGTDGALDPQPLPCPRHSPSTSLDLGGSPCSPQGSLLG